MPTNIFQDVAMDMKLELLVLPVTDVDRAKSFYEQLGFRLDVDHRAGENFRVVQLTPPGSSCSITIGTGLTTSEPGTYQGLHLVVADLPAVLAELAERGDGGRWLISSFRLETVDRCHLVDPGVPTSWLVVEIGPGTIDEVVRRGHVAVHPWEPTITAEQIAACHDAGLLVNGWTCNDPARFRQLASWGIDGLCTDIPDVMLAALTG